MMKMNHQRPPNITQNQITGSTRTRRSSHNYNSSVDYLPMLWHHETIIYTQAVSSTRFGAWTSAYVQLSKRNMVLGNALVEIYFRETLAATVWRGAGEDLVCQGEREYILFEADDLDVDEDWKGLACLIQRGFGGKPRLLS